MFKLLFLLFVIKWYVRSDIFKNFLLQYLRFSSIFWIFLYFFITKKIMTYSSQKVFIPATPFQIISPSLPPPPPPPPPFKKIFNLPLPSIILPTPECTYV